MTLNSKKTAKSVSFCTPLESTQPKIPTQPWSRKNLKPTLKTLTPNSNLPDQAETVSPTTEAAYDIISLKKAFPCSFDTIGNMPSSYIICINPSITLVQLMTWLNLGVIAPVTLLIKWVSSLNYPWKPDGTLCIYLNPRDLNKAIIQDHYKAPTLDEIVHCLSGDITTFIKLNVRNSFLSVYLDEKSSYLTNFKACKGRILVPAHAFQPEDVPGCFPDGHGSHQ